MGNLTPAQQKALLSPTPEGTNNNRNEAAMNPPPSPILSFSKQQFGTQPTTVHKPTNRKNKPPYKQQQLQQELPRSDFSLTTLQMPNVQMPSVQTPIFPTMYKQQDFPPNFAQFFPSSIDSSNDVLQADFKNFCNKVF
jgi:hypothetical protein